MGALEVYAGPTALAQVLREGVRAESFSTIVGASGGPKWFVLYGLDRYLFGEFFANRQSELCTLGSSAGAWRLSCLGLQDPLGGIDRLAKHYAGQRYSATPDVQEITRAAAQLVDIVLGENGAQEIASNAMVHVNIVADRSRGLLASEKRGTLLTGLGLSALSNLVSRRLVGLYFQRVVFHGGPLTQSVSKLDEFATQFVRLSADNVRKALLASGSIPLVLEGVTDIPGAPEGVYRDGGITDYHFDLPFNRGTGLVLYPHFYSHFIPGWFDKPLPWRKSKPENFHNVLVLAPSQEFVRQLPYGKIPDRKDFETMDYDTRAAYWQTVLAASVALADEFAEMVRTGEGLDRIQALGAAGRQR